MDMQIKMFVPLISGIVVGLAALTSSIMLNLGEQITALGEVTPGAGVGGAGPGLGLLEIFQIQNMLPSSFFQLMIGIYLVQAVFLLSYVLSGINYGPDKVEQEWLTAKNLFIGTVIYIIVTIAVVIMFSQLAAPIVGAVY